MKTPTRDDKYWQLLQNGFSDLLEWEKTYNIGEIILEKINRWIAIESLIKSDKIKKLLVGYKSNHSGLPLPYLVNLQLSLNKPEFSCICIIVYRESRETYIGI